MSSQYLSHFILLQLFHKLNVESGLRLALSKINQILASYATINKPNYHIKCSKIYIKVLMGRDENFDQNLGRSEKKVENPWYI